MGLRDGEGIAACDYESEVLPAHYVQGPAAEKRQYKAFQAKRDPQKDSQQYFLDLGQKNFGSQTCPDCGMMYSPGQVSSMRFSRTETFEIRVLCLVRDRPLSDLLHFILDHLILLVYHGTKRKAE